MKSKIFLAGAVMMMGIGFTSCDNALDEHPRAIITPDYFNTKSGIEKGINAL